jgi:type II secretory pathway pseudopilin PulG
MPTWLAIVLVVLVVIVVALALLGAVGQSRRQRAGAKEFVKALHDVDRALAAAAAEDKGWERGILEAAARDAFAQAHPDETVKGQELIQVLDHPGTDEDKAVFRVVSDHGAYEMILGRIGGNWVHEATSAA